MPKKPTIVNVSNAYDNTPNINANFEAVRDAFDNTLSRDGSTPNSMEADLDLNGYDLLNAKLVSADDIQVGGQSITSSVQASQAAAQASAEAAALSETNAAASETAAAASAALAEAWNDANTLWFDTVAEFLSFDGSSVEVGTYARTRDGVGVYQRVADGTGHVPSISRLWRVQAVNGEVMLTAFGASGNGVFDNVGPLTRALSTGYKVLIPEGVFYSSANATITASGTQVIGLSAPVVDFTTNTFTRGSIIKGIFNGSSGLDGVKIRNIGVDSAAASLVEGMVFSDFESMSVEDVTVIGSDTNNHCCLLQDGRGLVVRNFQSLGGKQGLAVKARDFLIDGVDSWDTTTYGFTFRYDTPYEGESGVIRNVRCRTNLRAKSGGFILMNDDVDGSAMADIYIQHVTVDDCTSGVYLQNLNNNTPMTRVKFSDVVLKNIASYAFQTWGHVENIDIDGVLIQDCNGAFYNNLDPNTNNLRIRNYVQDNVLFGSSISGANHQLYNWRKVGGGGGWGQNASANLQTFSMDKTVSPLTNITNAGGTGTALGGATSVALPAIGSLYSISHQTGLTKQFSQSMATDATVTIYTMPDNFGVLDVTVHALSAVGRHVARYMITGQTATLVSGNQFSTAHFVVGVSGTNVFFQFKGVSTATVQADCFMTVTAAA